MSAILVRYDAMCSAIAAAHAVDEVKDIRDKAVALALYARQANDTALERQVHDIRVRAERRTGELLRKMPKAAGARGQAGPGRGKTGSPITTPFSDTPTLKDFGITKDQSSEWQKLAAVPEEEFEEGLANPVALPTAAHIIAAHEAKTFPQPVPGPQVDDAALWLWGRIKDFQRMGLLDRDPNEVCETMILHMKETTRELAPVVATWLGRITG